jgi:putative ABC transport system permease protein
VQQFVTDVLDTIRGARRRPGFAAAVLLTLGIGIGAAAAVLAVLDAVLVRPLPYAQADRIHGIWFSSPNFPGGLNRVRQSVPTFVHIRDKSAVYEAVAIAERAKVTVEENGTPTRVAAGTVTAEIFPVLRIAPIRGRAFVADDNAPGAAPTVIISDALWSQRFSRDPAAIGQTMLVDGVQREIVGVLPDAVRFPENDTQLWLPLVVDAARASGQDFVYTAYGRLKPGVTDEAAAADFARLVQLLPETYPTFFPRPLVDRLKLSSLFVPLQQELVGDARGSLQIALLAVVVVLLIVVANVTNLFLVRNGSRVRDFAVRAANGATPARLARALVTEGVVYALAGGVLGLVLGAGFLGLLKQLGPTVIPRFNEVTLGLRTIGAMVALSAIVGVAAGLVPALRIHEANLGDLLRGGGKTVGLSGGAMRVRRMLVAGQVALALALLVNAGLLVRSLAARQAISPGFTAANAAGMRLYFSPRDFPTPQSVQRIATSAADAARLIPGVESAAMVSFLPLRDGRIFLPIQTENDQAATDLPAPRLRKLVTEDYFATMGIRITSGRAIERADIESNAPVVVVNAAFARAHWPDADPIGKRFGYGGGPGGGAPTEWLNIVGVVENVRDRELTSPEPPIFYAPIQPRHLGGGTWREMSIVVRGAAPASLLAPLRRSVAQINAGVPAWDARTMTQVLSDVNTRPRYTMLLVACAAIGALVLAAIGLYGVLAQLVSDRKREMALRIALGATPGSVRGMVVGHAVRLAGAGAIVGFGITALTSSVVAATLYSVRPLDAPTNAGVALLVMAVAWASARIPAARAAAVHPSVALKDD